MWEIIWDYLIKPLLKFIFLVLSWMIDTFGFWGTSFVIVGLTLAYIYMREVYIPRLMENKIPTKTKSSSPSLTPTSLGIKLTRDEVKPLKRKKKRSRRITQAVKDQVWNRDGGKCVECGSNEKLEFDHIIPFSKGGANTYRNIQLLCERCNREKSAKIG